MDEEDILPQIYTLDVMKSHDESRKYDQKEAGKQLKNLGRGGRPKFEKRWGNQYRWSLMGSS